MDIELNDLMAYLQNAERSYDEFLQDHEPEELTPRQLYYFGFVAGKKGP